VNSRCRAAGGGSDRKEKALCQEVLEWVPDVEADAGKAAATGREREEWVDPLLPGRADFVSAQGAARRCRTGRGSPACRSRARSAAVQ
jgi:hypothetical protein